MVKDAASNDSANNEIDNKTNTLKKTDNELAGDVDSTHVWYAGLKNVYTQGHRY